ncbi:carboxypeptidase-like regulatory domain-containing protein [Aestuariibaculum sediminum]|uniref:Carboxypeptidase-like regulatory domain-containing protein n=1 Tax=Aestuariibaculum sediminum TaxID=2770637 RepID=A0A8J6PZN2_9FLAO|nr:carboxypeptidase-like regulatory domain-containing protein [Aestuariibaculum sediminum]MBD0832403.1 hypothetical protein [Aestuariibaculum sediminum]
MKKLLLFVFVAINYAVQAQDFKRLEVQGKIIVESSDVYGITIFNASSNKGVISDEKGEFTLEVRLNDVIEVSALQFQNLQFQVNEAIMSSLKMKIFLIEEINKLDEIIILPNKLSGNLKTDIEATKNFSPKLDALYFGIKHQDEFSFERDYKSSAENIATPTQHITMVNGLNIVNVVDQLLLPLFRSKTPEKEEKGIPEVPIESVKYYFSSTFLTDNFNIPEHRVEEFIHYVQASDFDYSLLSYGKEMEFLEHLHDKSVEFLATK